MSKNGEFVWGPQMSLQHAQHKCRITSELGNLRRRPSKYNCFIFTQRHNTKQRWGGYLELTPMQRPWQDLLPLGPLRNTAAAICTEVGFCWGQERTEHWLHQCPFRPGLQHQSKKCTLGAPLISVKGCLPSPASPSSAIRLSSRMTHTPSRDESRQRLHRCFRPFYPFPWAVPREMTPRWQWVCL